jgi:hypothetical protein
MNGRRAIGALLCAATASRVLLMQDLRKIPGKDSDPPLSAMLRSGGSWAATPDAPAR